MCDAAEAKQKQRFPNMAERCQSCALRAGTFPNGCESTLMDVIKCLSEFELFYCHETKSDKKPVCAGYMTLLSEAAADAKPFPVPWDFSCNYAAEQDAT